ncbi:arrestin domain-containing protein 17 [Neodiprion lecontei]|uniref:Arrestin domain-containing protein 17 n=1 Tax=Neodiprion lecontei TaxID=441921 RepID=A0A6J0CB85_NEOLC|nr:arrestin domain-containing protein 17 [Neodiprion lecontei]
MGGTQLAIEYDRENGIYLPGELVSGRIVANFSSPKEIRGLRVKVVGEAKVRWTVKRGKSRTVYRGEENYFSSLFHLIGSDSGPTIELPAGHLVYPFSIQLPMGLPNSFEHKIGHIRYTIKATFDRPWKFDHEVKAAFTIVSAYNLNERPQAALSIHGNMQKSFCCFCMGKGNLSAIISIPSSGFVPGQIIPVTVECENNSTVEVEQIQVSLRQKLRFEASSPYHRSKKVGSSVIKSQFNEPFANKSEEPVILPLKVPALPPSNLEFCGIIDLDYVLRVTMSFSGVHCDIDEDFPILIGTVPLYGSFDMYSPNVRVTPSPSAPPLQNPADFTSTSFPGHSQPSDTPSPPYPSQGDPRDLPPPSYEQCMYGVQSIKDAEESDYVQAVPYAPRYPVYNYDAANTAPSAPMREKQ